MSLNRSSFSLVAASLMIFACSDSDNNNGGAVVVPPPIDVAPEKYEFASRDGASVSSVSYSGQTMRHILINDLTIFINDQLQADLDSGVYLGKSAAEVKTGFDFYFRFSDSGGAIQLLTTTNPGAKQTTYADISSGKDLVGKLAGNDAVGQHKDWNNGAFVGVGAPGSYTPTSYLDALLTELAENVVVVANGAQRLDVADVPLAIYQTTDGRDLKQLIQKFLLGAIAFSQAVDDYIDDDTAGKGLLADHNALVEGQPYTELEHAWDEAFGYFGAARNYLEYTDAELAKSGGRPEYAGFNDANSDGEIDFESEFNFGISVNAAKRDLGSANGAAPTDFSDLIMRSFLQGRFIMSKSDGPLSDQDILALQAERDIIALNWEKTIAASALHYINDMLQDLTAIADGQGSYSDYAKHWSEMKGFALSFQFNPRSPMSDTDFAAFHALVGDAPVLPDAEGVTEEDVTQYRQDLIAARALLVQAYDFDAANVGDDNGLNGW